MNRYVYLVLSVAVFGFLVGLAWGVYSYRHSQDQLAHSSPLRILCPEAWVTEAFLNRFSKVYNVRIEHFSYDHPSDFLRQMANSDSKVDVICTSSLLVRSLVVNRWLKKIPVQSLANSKNLAVDFSNLPYDPASEFSVPLFWNLYGFLGKEEPQKASTWKQTWDHGRVSLWGEELNVLNLMDRLNLSANERLTEEQRSEAISSAFKKFTKSTIYFLKPSLDISQYAAKLSDVDWIQIPLAQGAKLLAERSDLHFWLPEDGATMELAVLAVGEKAPQPELALKFINEMISTENALDLHERLHAGVVLSTLNGVPTIDSMQKPEALRKFPLNRLRFPDVNVDDLPRFQKVFDESTERRDPGTKSL